MKRAITKVLEELKKEAPDLSYIRGLLEGAVEEEPVLYTTSGYSRVVMPSDTTDGKHYDAVTLTSTNYTKSDEQEVIPEALRPGPLGNLSA